MGLTAQQSLMIKYEYYEVFDENKQIRYGITSKEEKEIIEKKISWQVYFWKIWLVWQLHLVRKTGENG